MAPKANEIEEFAKNSGLFAVDLYNTVANEKPNQNIVFSPFSIQTCVAMARMGALGETAKEIDRGLRLVSSDEKVIAQSFSHILADYVNSNVLKIANKIYVKTGYNLKKEFNDLITKEFHSSTEAIDFSKSHDAAKNINNWVESKTNNLIKDLVSSDMFDDDTRLVLLNAIHFKGKWKYTFPVDQTRDEDFYLNEVDTVKVKMMNLKANLRYAQLPELDATALELPYNDTDLSMLIILPNSRTGLKNLEEKLLTVTLSDVTSKLFRTEVVVKLPRFKAEFSMELSSVLKKLGLVRMFGNNAEFDKMLEKPEPLTVSKVIHKAFIDVNEEGTEAAAATANVVRMKRSLPSPPKKIIADHPFIYAIHQLPPTSSIVSNAIIFAGSLRIPSSLLSHDEL